MQPQPRVLLDRPIAAVGLFLSRIALNAVTRDGARVEPLAGIVTAGARRLARASLTDLENDILGWVAGLHPRVATPDGGGVDAGDGRQHVELDPPRILRVPSNRVEHYCQRLAEKGLLDLAYPRGYRLSRIGHAVAGSD